MLDRYIGSMIGLAIGDALGAPVEFKRRDQYDWITEFKSGGTWQLEAGQWTDDTSLALCLADSFIEKQKFDAQDQMERYTAWWRKGHNSSTGQCFDIGNTTFQALSIYEKNKTDPLCGLTDEMSAGNGSIMRLAPAALFYADNTRSAVEWCGKTSKTTHSHKACVDACRYYSGLIIGALKSVPKKELLDGMYHPLGNYWQGGGLDQNVKDVAEGSYKTKQRKLLGNTSYIIHTLECALWAFYRSESFEEGAILAVNLGGDTDTIGAVYGQLAGAYYGIENMPKRWVEKLHDSIHIKAVATALYNNRWKKN